VYDPGADAAERYPHITIRRAALRLARSAYFPRRQLILVDEQLDRAGWDASVAHELVHLDRGDLCSADNDVLHAKVERAVEVEAARRLIPFHRLLAAMEFGWDEHELAHELGVDVELLRARCDYNNLRPHERDEIDRRRAEAEQWGAA